MQQPRDNGSPSIDTFKANTLLGHPADGRKYAFAADILRYFGAHSIHLLGHSPNKKKDLEDNGIIVIDLIALVDRISKASIAEFIAKLLKGHQFKYQAIETVNEQIKLMLEGSLEIPNSLLLALPEFVRTFEVLLLNASNNEVTNELGELLWRLSAYVMCNKAISKQAEIKV